MTERTAGRTRRRRDTRREGGQVLVIFALALVTMLAMAGLLIDGGRAWSDHRIVQNAADAAALAAAKAISLGDATYTAKSQDVGAVNGFPKDLLTCAGTTQVNKGVEVRYPPTTGPHTGDNTYVEVVVSRRMSTAFAHVVGQGCWLITARAVAQTVPASPTGPTILAMSSTCAGSNSGIVWNGHNTVVTQGDVISNGDIDMSGSGSITPPGEMKFGIGCSFFEHGNDPAMATEATTVEPNPFTYTLADFHCQAGPLPTKLAFPDDLPDPGVNVIPSGTYCATDSIVTRSADSGTLTGTVTFIAPQVTFNADPQTLRPYENGVLAWATGTASSAINFKAEGDWGGILYAPTGGVHVVSKANTVVNGNIWARNVDLGGDDWSIAGPVSSTGSAAIVKLVE